ncbi:hypothetical protein [Geodermatophilus ruber]|nr:hypothetical protein [Geodermatophilus ruber]
MRAVELEGRVVAAIDARRNANVPPEDDFVECKGRWPEKDKARQLAGLANRAAGEPVVLIVGFDDRSGEVVDPGATDPADWWQGMVGQFDQTPLDVLRHMLVHISATEKVHAFAFGTDRVPYVVKNGQGRDVPMREGTSTRSAYRHELLRLLLPSIGHPPSTLLKVDMWLNSGGNTGGAERKSLNGYVTPFVEHMGTSPLMLPTHAMRASIAYGDTVKELSISPSIPTSPIGQPRPKSPASAHGAELRTDGVVLTGPAAFPLQVHLSELLTSDYDEAKAADSIQFSATLPIAGTNRPIKLNGELTRQPLDDWYKGEGRGESWHFIFRSTGEPISEA